MTTLGARLDALAREATTDLRLPDVAQLVVVRRRRRTTWLIASVTASTVIALVAALVLLLPPGSEQVHRVATAPPPSSVPIPLNQLAVAAEQQATANGDPHPRSAVAVATSLHRQGQDEPTYEVELIGHFTCTTCFGAQSVTGSSLVFDVERSSLRVVSFAVPRTAPNLALDGPVYSLLQPPPQVPLPAHLRVEAVAATSIEAAALSDSGCAIPSHLTGDHDLLAPTPGHSACTSVTVRLYPTFADAAAVLPELVEPGLDEAQPNRALYVVTVHGQLPFATHCLCSSPPYVDHDTSFFDALTGDPLGGGTARTALP